MAIYRCNSCGHLLELPNDSVGASLPCPRCARPNTAYDTTVFVRKVVEKYFALRQSRRARNPTPVAAQCPW